MYMPILMYYLSVKYNDLYKEMPLALRLPISLVHIFIITGLSQPFIEIFAETNPEFPVIILIRFF